MLLHRLLTCGLHAAGDPEITLSPAPTVHHPLEKAGAPLCALSLSLWKEGQYEGSAPLLPAEETAVPVLSGGTGLTSSEKKQGRIMLEDYFTSPFPVQSS